MPQDSERAFLKLPPKNKKAKIAIESISELEAFALTSSFKPRFFKTSSTIQKIPIIFIYHLCFLLFLFSYLIPPEGRKI